MPNKFTEHYNLNQWEKTDKVLMEDFNEDNRKIDEALRNTRPHLIRSWVTDEDAASINFDITGIEWAKYSWVIFDVLLPSLTSVSLTVRGSTAGRIAESLPQTHTCVTICPVFYRDNTYLTCFTMAKAGSFGTAGITYRNLKTLTLAVASSSSQYIRAGTEVKIWGML